jgi:membrane protease YdiL (CAAX protease family)
VPEVPPVVEAPPASLTPEFSVPAPESRLFRWVNRAFIGSQGLRAGWSVSIFAILFVLFSAVAGLVFLSLHLIDSGKHSELNPSLAFFGELTGFLALVGAVALMAFIERRGSLLAYNLTGPQRIPHFFRGLAAGFTALSVLVGAMTWGGWLHFGSIALSGAQIFQCGALWAGAFLLVGIVEEGIFRCYLQFTLTRGINFWWALGIIGSVCLWLALKDKGNGAMGVYIVALLGLFPCLILQVRKTPRSGFWQAAWVTSTLFGSIHTGNGGENWIGIFAAALIGFVFCVSIWVTGSAWWAIGCHAAWDWAETFFYGTADSGLQPQGHYLTTSPVGNALWSGGADGPEGSMLVIGAILLLLALLLVVYGHNKPVVTPVTE